MRELSIGGKTIDAERVGVILTSYATEHWQSVQWYDLGGADEIAASDSVSLKDIGRMMLINPHMNGNDVALLLELGKMAPWHLVPHNAHLSNALLVKHFGLYDDAMELHNYFASRDGIGDETASMLLHIKRPWLYPILDRYVKVTYDMFATTVASVAGRGRQSFWEAIRIDLHGNAAALWEIRIELANSADENIRRMRLLPEVRFLDIIASHLGRQLPESSAHA